MEDVLNCQRTPRQAPDSPKPSARLIARLDALAPYLVGLCALALNLIRLGGPSVWMDEAFSIALARQPLPVLMAAFSSGGEPNMIAYHLILHGWLAFGGALGLRATEFFVRLPSAVFAAAACVTLYALGRRWLGRTAALVAALAYLMSNWQLAAAQEARGYALQLALVIVGWLALLAAVSSPARKGDRRVSRWWALFVVAMSLAVYAQVFSALILLAQGLAFGVWLVWPGPWRERARLMLPAAVRAFVAIGLLIAPFAWASRHGSKTSWLPSPDSLASLQSLATWLTPLRGAALLGVVLVGGALMWLLRSPTTKRLLSRAPAALTRLGRADGGALAAGAGSVAVALALWVVVPWAVSYLVSLGPLHIFSSRYLVVTFPALCLLLGMAVAALRWPLARVAALELITLVLLALLPLYYTRAQAEEWRPPVRWLEQSYRPGDGLVAYNNLQGCELPVEYYLWMDGSPARFDDASPGALRFSLYGHGDPFGSYQQALNPAALAAYAARHPRLFFIEGRLADPADSVRARATQAWLDAHYRFLGQTSTAVVTIRLYDTRPAAA